jgi:hypothetical protein
MLSFLRRPAVDCHALLEPYLSQPGDVIVCASPGRPRGRVICGVSPRQGRSVTNFYRCDLSAGTVSECASARDVVGELETCSPNGRYAIVWVESRSVAEESRQAVLDLENGCSEVFSRAAMFGCSISNGYAVFREEDPSRITLVQLRDGVARSLAVSALCGPSTGRCIDACMDSQTSNVMHITALPSRSNSQQAPWGSTGYSVDPSQRQDLRAWRVNLDTWQCVPEAFGSRSLTQDGRIVWLASYKPLLSGYVDELRSTVASRRSLYLAHEIQFGRWEGFPGYRRIISVLGDGVSHTGLSGDRRWFCFSVWDTAHDWQGLVGVDLEKCVCVPLVAVKGDCRFVGMCLLDEAAE